jgi:predicted nucleic acid-binding protein
VEVLLRTPRSVLVLRAIGDAEMVAPDLITVEVLSTLRRLIQQDLVTPVRADQAVSDLVTAPVHRVPTLPLADAIWQWRHNLSTYDACYMALADALGCPLITGDARLARAPRLPVHVIVP